MHYARFTKKCQDVFYLVRVFRRATVTLYDIAPANQNANSQLTDSENWNLKFPILNSEIWNSCLISEFNSEIWNSQFWILKSEIETCRVFAPVSHQRKQAMRGTACVQRWILKGFEETGVTLSGIDPYPYTEICGNAGTSRSPRCAHIPNRTRHTRRRKSPNKTLCVVWFLNIQTRVCRP
jgi:hypothetical protein